MANDKQVAVLGVGMHPWGKWGRPFVEYGVAAAQDALADAGLGWRDVEFVSGADTTPKGFFAPVGGGDRKDDPDWLRFHLLGATNPTYFALYARRRMDRFGATEEDFAQVKVKNARHGLANPYA